MVYFMGILRAESEKVKNNYRTGGGGARTFSMAHMMKSTLGGGWCKTQISKSTQGSFFVFRWGCGVLNGDFEKYEGTFFYEK